MAFRTQYRHYKYLVMPIRLTNAPTSFQAIINNMLQEHLNVFVIAYLDDILIFSKMLKEHKQHMHQVLQKLLDAKLLVELKKSKFYTQEVDFLGCTIKLGKIRMQEKKIAVVKEQLVPTNVTDVQAFLGFINFYWKFIKDYSKTIIPLIDLTKKNQNFKQNTKANKAFVAVKKAITEQLILVDPDPSKPYEVETDASGFALGGQLGQQDAEGRLHLIAFFLKKLHRLELYYPILDQELIAIVKAFKEQCLYLIKVRH